MENKNYAKRARRSGVYKPRYLKEQKPRHILRNVIAIGLAALLISPTVQMLKTVATGAGMASTVSGSQNTGWTIMDRFDTFMTNVISDALSGVKKIEKVYWLSDEEQIAPSPNPDKYGSTTDPSELQWLLDTAAEKLGVTDLYFSTDTQIMPGSEVVYYLDDTILTITWKEVHNSVVYTLSEVKIAHASQFRRFLADGTYGAEKQYYPSEMAITVNAVTASSGDFYKFRDWGINVYQGKVRNIKTIVDNCFITDTGDLIFKWAGEIDTLEEAQSFVDENNIRFSLAFGPIMVVDGENVCPTTEYPLGQNLERYARMGLCQMGQLHYLLAAANTEGAYNRVCTTSDFADQLIAFGAKQAYALDGGQTASIITNDKLINRPVYGVQRQISDIIYFATAIPESQWNGA